MEQAEQTISKEKPHQWCTFQWRTGQRTSPWSTAVSVWAPGAVGIVQLIGHGVEGPYRFLTRDPETLRLNKDENSRVNGMLHPFSGLSRMQALHCQMDGI